MSKPDPSKPFSRHNPDRNKNYNKSRENPRVAELIRKNKLWHRYNLTVDEYNKLLESQGRGCAICGKTPEELGKYLVVDHDHSCCPPGKSCGKCVRGLLCTNCNTKLGWYENNMININDYLANLGAD